MLTEKPVETKKSFDQLLEEANEAFHKYQDCSAGDERLTAGKFLAAVKALGDELEWDDEGEFDGLFFDETEVA
ncbi:hypothetical protein JQS35_19055, partial [Alcaligenes faecalis subsp. faecalis]|uniref:hypothetical protein n=1 Tax=Alcaligenes faecalis TaxID=511 RepID=UPI001F19EEDD